MDAIKLPADWAPKGAFLLKHTGDNLEADHILTNDYVLVHPTTEATPGDLIVRLDGDVAIVEHYDGTSNFIGRVRGVLRVLKG